MARRSPAPASAPAAAARTRPSAARGMGASLAATVAANLPAFLCGGLAVQMKDDLGFGAGALGIAIGAFSGMGALTVARMGRLVERVGAARMLRAAAGASAAVLTLIALVAHSYPVLLALMALGGIANAGSQPAANVFLVRIVAPDRLGFALGLQKSAIPMGALLGGLAVPAFGLTVGWRWAFAAGAVLAVAAAWWIPADPIGSWAATAGSRRGGGARPDVPVRTLALLAVGVGLGAAASNAMSAFTVSGGVAVGLAEGAAGVLLTIGSVAGIAVRLAAGARADRGISDPLRTIAVMFVLAALAFAGLASDVRGLFVAAVPLAFATAFAWPGLFHLAVVRANPSAPGAASGIAITGTLAGAIAGPITFGVVADAAGYPAAWAGAAIVLLAAAAIVVTAGRRIAALATAARGGDAGITAPG